MLNQQNTWQFLVILTKKKMFNQSQQKPANTGDIKA